jgi:hypothetical protein
MQGARTSIADKIYNYTNLILYALPALIGIFWGAPLIARELETGTYRLAWNQSVTRTRWLATKVATVGLASMATAGVLSLAVTAWAHHIDRINDNRITPFMFSVRGIAPIGYAAFAFAVGVTAGMLIRRTVPAMAATLAIYIAAVAPFQLLRAHLLPLTTRNVPLDTNNITALLVSGPGGSGNITVLGDNPTPGAWMISNQTLTPAGAVFDGPASPAHCGADQGPQSCMAWINSLGLRQHVSYQPAGHFWPLQSTEAGIFVAVALALIGFCFWWVRHRLI